MQFKQLGRQVFGAVKCDPQFSGPQRNAGGKIPEEVLAHSFSTAKRVREGEHIMNDKVCYRTIVWDLSSVCCLPVI